MPTLTKLAGKPAQALGRSGNNVSVEKNGAGNASLKRALASELCLNARSYAY